MKLTETQDRITGCQNYIMEAPTGHRAVISQYGAILRELIVPGPDNRLIGTAISLDSILGYEDNPFIGRMMVGRIAGIAYHGEVPGLTKRAKPNWHSHHVDGGKEGWGMKTWSAQDKACTQKDASVILTLDDYSTADMPGDAIATLETTMQQDGTIRMVQNAKTAGYPITGGNSIAFNLKGAGGVLGHAITAECDRYCLTEHSGNTSSPMTVPQKLDITTQKSLGLLRDRGVFHAYFLFRQDDKRNGIILSSRKAGLSLHMETDQPGFRLCICENFVIMSPQYSISEASKRDRDEYTQMTTIRFRHLDNDRWPSGASEAF